MDATAQAELRDGCLILLVTAPLLLTGRYRRHDAVTAIIYSVGANA